MSCAHQLVILFALSCIVASKRDLGIANASSFFSYMSLHGRRYLAGSKEYKMRQSIYLNRLKQIQHHNSLPHRHWTAAVNHLTDRTDAELAQLRGLRTVARKKAAGAVGSHRSGALLLGQIKNASDGVPDSVSWSHLSIISQDVNQGNCGSCWAMATSTMLQANAEIKGYSRTFSAQELVNCVPNPYKCGGEGGCEGATMELAMNWAMSQGLTTDMETPYTATDQECAKDTATMLLERYEHDYDAMVRVGYHAAAPISPGYTQLQLQGWWRLGENDVGPLMRAVAEIGPVAVSVSADKWTSYGSGIFDSCPVDATINHAVVLIGYGEDASYGLQYWTIKNSWGSNWGEEYGTMRLLRRQGDEQCGTDYHPEEGTGCEGGPATVPVCGMCGILYDSVVPDFIAAS